MESRFTQGEWQAKEGQIYSLETGKTHAVIPYFDQNNEEQKANQNLIAASKDLLNCCIDTLRILELKPTYTNQYQRDKLKAVIQKAQGE